MPSTATSILDGLSASVAVKAPCRTVATSNITLSGLQTISGYTTVENDRVLVKGQTDPVDNGIYMASTGSWTRAKDADGNRDLVQGTRVLVRSTTVDGAEYELTTANPIVIGTTALTFELRYGANARYDQTEVEIANSIVPTNYGVAPGNVLRYGTNAVPGTTDMTAAFTAARTVTSGRYHIPRGTYKVDASPDVWTDAFTADGGASIVIGATTHDVSNAFCGRLRYVAASHQKTDVYDANTGDLIQYIQNIDPGTAFGFYKGLAIQFNGHWAQVSPRETGGSVDLLWQRAPDHATDPAGNRFNQTFEETADRMVLSYATTASGAPNFDSYMIVVAGLTPSITFPAIQPQFNHGWSVKQRAAGGFEIELEPTSSTVATLKQIGGSATTFLTFRDAAMGFFGSTGTSKPTVTGSRGGNAALASLLTALASLGLITDSSTA